MRRSALLLDAAGTLFDLEPTLEARLRTAFGPERSSTSEQVMTSIDRANRLGTWPEDQTSPEARIAVWTTFVTGLLADIPNFASTRAEHGAAAIAAQIADPGAYAVTAGAVPLLQAAKAAGVRCAVVSNFDHLLLDILNGLELLHLLDHVTFSGDLGIYKPDRRVFDTALRALGVRAEESMMVSD